MAFMQAVSPCKLRLEQHEGFASQRRAEGRNLEQFVIATAEKSRIRVQRDAVPDEFIYRTAPEYAQ